MNKLVAKGLDSIADGIDAVGRLKEATHTRLGRQRGKRLRPMGRFVPPPPPEDQDEESLDVWGFADTRFTLNERGHVELSGNRYSLCGEELPNLLPWVQDILQVDIDPNEVFAPHYPPPIPEPTLNEAFMQAIGEVLAPDQIVLEPRIRLRHAHGHSQEEMFAIKYGKLGRVPDVVIYPSDDQQVCSIVAAAREHGVSLLPFGGGTNVSKALQCDPSDARSIVSVDMRRMRRILWIDPVNQIAQIQAGAVGRDIMAQLAQHGYTMGHEPDSVEFSTLGGWIATHASGMKKNRYGNIEDLVLDVELVTPDGTLTRASITPRESTGIDLRRLAFGSEGNLGIVTSAVVKLFPLPETQRYGSVLFRRFEDGVSFMYELTREGAAPASVRLVDNLQFQFSLALKPGAKGWHARKSQLEKLFVTKLKGFDPNQMVACTLVFEGTAEQVAEQEAKVYAIAKRHGGMKAGAENGKRGYQLTYSIAYIRDFVMTHYVIAESFETSVAWSEAVSLCTAVKDRVHREYEARGLPGRPFISARVTQVYPTGVCIYFYLAFYFKGVEAPSEVFAELEEAARDEILRQGGSLSHHHGVGKLRAPFMPRIMSRTALQKQQDIKQIFDPDNVFGSGNHRPQEPKIRAVGS